MTIAASRSVGISRLPAANTTMGQALIAVVSEKGWKPGTVLENHVMLQLSRAGFGPGTPDAPEQQYRVGRYTLDFAWPRRGVALEADGYHHRSADVALKDCLRDCWLRAEGWVVLRVDDAGGEESLVDQMRRVLAVLWPASMRGKSPAAPLSRGAKPASRKPPSRRAARIPAYLVKYEAMVPAAVTDMADRLHQARLACIEDLEAQALSGGRLSPGS